MNELLAERPPHVPPDHVVDFDVWSVPDAETDLYAAWERLRAPGLPDVVWTPRNGGHWIATRLKAMAEAFEDYRRFSSRVLSVPKEIGEMMKLLPVTLDPPLHRPYRQLLNSSFAPKVVQGHAERIRAVAAALIESFRLDGACEFQAQYAAHLPIRLFIALADLPPEDVPKLKSWSDQLVSHEGLMSGEEATAKFAEYLSSVYDERLGNGHTDILSRLINGRIGDRAQSKEEAISICTLVIHAGLDTVVKMLGFTMFAIAQSPEHRLQLLAEPGLIPDAVEEILRRFPIVMNCREVAEDTELAGVTLKAGEMLILPTPLAGTDEREAVDARVLDFRRRERHHVTFGGGSHRCPGAPLARLELQITFEEWLKRIPEFKIAPGARVLFKAGETASVRALPLIWDPASTHAVSVG